MAVAVAMEEGLPRDIRETLTSRSHEILQPTPALHSSFLELAKQYLDPLANNVTQSQLDRQVQHRQSRKRRRRQRDEDDSEELLRMRKVYVQGFSVQQVWQQAKKVLDATVDEVNRDIPRDAATENGDQHDIQDLDHARGQELEGSEDYNSDAEGPGLNGELGTEDEDEDEEFEDSINGEMVLEDEEDDFYSRETERRPPDGSLAGETFVKDKFGLNDGFFSIDKFNKDSQFLERQDARGDPDDGAASDEEDIDWDANPFTTDPRIPNERKPVQKTGGKTHKNNFDDDEDDEDGPTFGNMDLDAPEGASEDELDEDLDNEPGLSDFGNANNILYSDFFAPPARSKDPANERKMRKKVAFEADSTALDEELAREEDSEDLQDVQRTMSAAQRDLFDEQGSENDEPDEYDVPDGQNKANLSTHEKRQLALRAEIRRLESENVASKPWTLVGETVAPSRPVNSLLEEDLDFERVGKPVPVITEEVSDSIEALIKRRIIARDFNELIRRRPDDLITGRKTDPRRGRLQDEISDSKPKQGLAEEYEQEHLRRTDPNYVDSRSEALKQTHAQIETHWASISAQLDALTNWHYKPRPAAASLDIRVDAPTISMEDARPSAGGDVGGASRLAPQELFRPGEDGKRAGQLITRGGTAIAQEEESRESRRRRRRREKERLRKATGNKDVRGKENQNGHREASAENQEVVSQLKKGGVRVIDRKGQLRDIDGTRASQSRQPTSSAAGALKL